MIAARSAALAWFMPPAAAGSAPAAPDVADPAGPWRAVWVHARAAARPALLRHALER